MSIWVCDSCMRLANGAVCGQCGKTAVQVMPRPASLLPEYELHNNRYRIGRVLGSGGFGITYRALDTATGKIYAIKEYFPKTLVSRSGPFDVKALPGMEQMFTEGLKKVRREYDTLIEFNKLDGIVHAYDAFYENNTAYIVMEYVEGDQLAKRVRDAGPMPPDKLFNMLRAFFTSLGELHKGGMIHRDISPTNLMVCPDGQIKLIDFGAARPTPKNGDDRLTVFVHHGYAPPELYNPRGQGIGSDIYSACATVYYALTGVEPPKSLERRIEDKLVPPSKMGVKIDPAREKAIMRGMSLNINDRQKSVQELINELYPQKPQPARRSAAQAAPAPAPHAEVSASPELGRSTLYAKMIAARRAMLFMQSFSPLKYTPKIQMLDEIMNSRDYGVDKWRDVELLITSSGKFFMILTALYTGKQ